MPMRNFTELDALVDDYLNSTTATAARVADFIRMAEHRMVGDFSENGLLSKLEVTETLTTDTSPKPLNPGYRGTTLIYLTTNPKQVLDFFPPDEFFRRYMSSQTGRPKAYTVRALQLHFGPEADSSYSAVHWYRKVPDIKSVLNQVLVDQQDETDYDNSPSTEGTFAGGASHAVDDVITLSDGSTVTVDAVSTGAVTEFTVSAIGDSDKDAGDQLTQSSTTGSGTGFSLTLDQDNLTNPILAAYPNLYLYATLSEGFDFLGNERRATMYERRYLQLIDSLEDEARNHAGGLQIHLRGAGVGTPRRRGLP